MDIGHGVSRLRNRVHQLTSDHFGTETNASHCGGRSREGQAPDRGGLESSGQRRSDPSRPSLQPGFLVDVLLGAQEDRGLAPHPEPEAIECVHKTSTVQDGHSLHHTEVPHQGKVGGHFGPQGRLLACPGSGSRPALAQVSNPGPDLPMDMSSLWPFDFSKGVYPGGSVDRGSPQTQGRQHSNVFGRLADIWRVSGGDAPSLSPGNRPSTTLGICSELRQIPFDALPGHHVPGGPSPSRPWGSGAISGEGSHTGSSSQGLGVQGPGSSARVAAGAGLYGQYGRCDTILPLPYAENTTAFREPVQPGPALGVQDGFRVGKHHGGSVLVGQPRQPDFRDSIPSASSRASPHDGRVEVGLGGPPARLPSLRKVVDGGVQPSYKSSRDVCCGTFTSRSRETGQGSSFGDPVRQLDGGCLPQQAGGDALSQPVSRGSSPSGVVQRKEHIRDGGTHSGGSEPPSGRTLPRSNESVWEGMDTEPRGCSVGVQVNLLAIDRPVRIQDQSSASRVLLPVARPAGSCSRCPVDRLGGNDGVRLPTDPDVAESDIEDRSGGLPCHSGRAVLAATTVVSTNGGPAGGDTKDVAGPSGSSKRSARKGSNISTGRTTPDCMAIIRDRCREEGFSGRVASLIAAGRRDSTLNAYSKRLGPYYRWCETRGISPTKAPVTEVAEFLTDRFESGLESSTVRNYKSAILAIHRGFEDGSTIDDDGSIRHLLNGMFNSRPPARKEVPTWDLNTVLEYLKGPPFEPMVDATLKDVTLKTVFLVSLASGRRCSEIQALSLSALEFSRNRAVLLFRPDFRAKNESMSFEHAKIILPRIACHSSVAEDRFWCPVRALEYYKRKTASIRGPNDQLFLTHNFPHGPASRQTLARWVASVITDAGAMPGYKPRAHSTRNVASSWAYHRGISVDDICKAVSWKAQSTFSSVYYRNVLSAQEKVALAVLRK